MAGRLFGSANIGNGSAPAVAGFKVQTAVYGLPIPIVYGQARVAGNLIHMYPSTATPQLSQGSRSKLVKVDQQVTGYLYQAPIALALSEGPIIGIGKVWRDKDAGVAWAVYNTAGWSLFLGTLTQAAWTFLTSNHPADAVPYQLTAYVAHPSLELPNDVLSNYTWEVEGLFQYGGFIVDANPKDAVIDVLTDANHGCGFPSAQLDALTGYGQYCIAAGLFMSPVLNSQGSLIDPLAALFEATNSGAVWSDGKLKVIPYADQAITGNSVTYTPNVTPIYDITDDDYIAAHDEDPVKSNRKKPAECFNQVLVEFEDRAHDYNPNVQEAKDQTSIELYGLRSAPSLRLPFIKDATTARYVGQLWLQRELNVRNTYQFTLGLRYSLLEPMDLVTLTDVTLGLSKETVRITQIEESETGDLVFTAEDFPAGVASASRYGAAGAAGNTPANNIAPGPTTAQAIFEGPGPLLQSALEIWLAASGGANWGGCDVHFSTDNVTYIKVGSITRKGNFGVLTAALATAAASPPNDTTHTLAVDLTPSGGLLAGGSAADLAALVTLSIVETEFIAYQTASLSSAFHYNLTTLERGLFGSPIPSSHAIGSAYVRCDGSILKVPYPQGIDGQVVYFKFPAFNVFGLALEDIAGVSAVSHTIGKNAVTTGTGGGVLPIPSLGSPVADINDLATTVHAVCSPGSTPASALTYLLTKRVGSRTPVTLSSGFVSALPIDVLVVADPRLDTVIRLLVGDPLYPAKTIDAVLTIGPDGRDGARNAGHSVGSSSEDDARSGTGGLPVSFSRLRPDGITTDDGQSYLIDPVARRLTTSISGPNGTSSTLLERGSNRGDGGFTDTIGSMVSTAKDSRAALLNNHFRFGVDGATGVVESGTQAFVHPSYTDASRRPMLIRDQTLNVDVVANDINVGQSRARGGFTNATGALVSTSVDSRSSLVNAHFRLSVDSTDSIVDGTGSPISGGKRGQLGLNSSNLLVTGVTIAALGSDGYSNIESRRSGARQAGHAATGLVNEGNVRAGNGGMDVPAGKIFTGHQYNATGDTVLVDAALQEIQAPLAIGSGVRGAQDVAFKNLSGTSFIPSRHNEDIPGTGGDVKTFGVSFDAVPNIRALPLTWNLPGTSSTVTRKMEVKPINVTVSTAEIRAVYSTGSSTVAETELFALTDGGTTAIEETGIPRSTANAAAFARLANANNVLTTYTFWFDLDTTALDPAKTMLVKVYTNASVGGTVWTQVGSASYGSGQTLTDEVIQFDAIMNTNWAVRVVVTYSGPGPTTGTATCEKVTYDQVTAGTEIPLTDSHSVVLVQATEIS